MTEFGVKWLEKGWYDVKQNNQPTNQINGLVSMISSETQ